MPARRVTRSPRALLDLEEILDHLDAEAGIELATRFIEAAESAFQRLLEFPELGASRQWLSPLVAGLRMWPIPDFPHHLIFYRPTETGIEVVRVLHAARDIQKVIDDA